MSLRPEAFSGGVSDAATECECSLRKPREFAVVWLGWLGGIFGGPRRAATAAGGRPTGLATPLSAECGRKLAAIKGLGDLVGRLALRTGFHGARDRVHELLSRNIDPGKVGALAQLLQIGSASGRARVCKNV